MIECKDLIKIYAEEDIGTRIPALRGIDIKIKPGEIISIVGPSGSGKTTLVNILSGTETISSGSVRVGEYYLEKMKLDEMISYRLHTIGLVDQFPERNLFLNCSVWDNLLFSSSLITTEFSEAKERNEHILEALGLIRLKDRRVNVLSGGEMIRVAIASVLAKNAPVLLCDEPTGQLDTENTERVKSVLRDITREFETTVIVVTHDLRFHDGVDKTCEIRDGRVSTFIDIAEQRMYGDNTSFPLRFRAHMDSSNSIRIPDLIVKSLQLANDVEISIAKSGRVSLKNPEEIPPLEIELKEIRKLRKSITIESLEANHWDNKESIIEFQNVSKIYQNTGGDIPALTDINIKFSKGEIAFIIGPSGSGKTTFIKLLTGLEPNTGGTIKILSTDFGSLSDKNKSRFRRENMGIVSQQGNLHPFLTVADNIFLKDVFSNIKIPSDLKGEKIAPLFESYHIDHRLSSYPLEISGGELQRASLAIANYKSPQIIIMDEPTANLDSELAQEVIKQVFEFHKKVNATILIATHDINLINEGNRVIELVDGKINRNGFLTITE